MDSVIQQQTNDSSAGYCKMPDGTLIQWGIIAVAREKGINTSDLINYLIPFIDFPRTFASMNTSAYAPYLRVFPGESTKSTLRVTVLNEGDTAFAEAYASWLAIGRWK